MTLPPQLPISSSPSAPPLTPAAATPSPTILFPLGWLMDHASAPIRFRAITEVAKLSSPVPEQVASLPFTHRPALTLAMMQSADGTWGHTMLTVPAARADQFEGIGTISAVRRLLEYGWHRDTPPLIHARRILFRLLAEDNDPDYLFEFGVKGAGDDEEMARRGRAILREAAAATLAQAGYEEDPRLRGAARRIVERVSGYLRSPLARDPFVRVGNQHALPAEATPPSIYTLLMLAHMPQFRNEHHETMALLYHHVAEAHPRYEAIQVCGKKIVAQPHLVLGDRLPNHNVADTDVPFAMMWLELMARLGFLRKNDAWSALFDRFLDDRDSHGIWHPHKGTSAVRSSNPFVWPIYPLEERMSGDERLTDMTFRLGLIGRLIGRGVEIA